VLAGIFFIGAVGTALAPNVAIMVVARVVLGLAVGGASATVPVYLAEIAPKELRGRLVAVDQLMIVTGQLLAYSTNAVLANVWGGHSTWRFMLVAASLPAIALWVGMRFMPETARWYASKDRFGEAMDVLRGTRGDGDDIKSEINEMLVVVQEEKAEKGGWADLKTPWIKRLVIIGVGIAVLQQLTGVNTLMYYAPTILTKTGLGKNAALTATIANGVVSVIASAVGLWLVSRLPRRRLLITGQVGIIASLAAIGITFGLLIQPSLAAGNAPPTSGSFVVLAFMLCFLVFQQGAVSPVTWVMLSEIFPMRMRGFGMGLSVFLMWIANAIITFSFPVLISTFGGMGTFLVFAAINVGTAIFTLRMVPETGHLTLEELEQEFRHPPA
jgi:major inositol transporter-like SP family MFS transporter